MSGPVELAGPDLAQGVPMAEIPEGELVAAHAFGKPLVVVRRGDSVQTIGAQCTHYGGPLAEGLLVDDTVRCPWHHACFSLRTGEATRAPALNPVSKWAVEVREGKRPRWDHWAVHVELESSTSHDSRNPPGELFDDKQP